MQRHGGSPLIDRHGGARALGRTTLSALRREVGEAGAGVWGSWVHEWPAVRLLDDDRLLRPWAPTFSALFAEFIRHVFRLCFI
jgi:hypothetical protein